MTAIATALVVGGGIGGLTAAIALRQNGVAVDLIEIQPDFTVYGVGIIQPNNTLRALDKIGLARACVERGAPFPGWRMCDAAGNSVFDAVGTSEAAPDFPPNNGITRPIFQQLLHDRAVEMGMSLRLGLTWQQLEQSVNHVDVTLTDGSTGRYDLVVASDGLNSKTRQRLFPEAPQPIGNGQGVWRYNLPRPTEMIWGEIHSSTHSKVGLVPMSPTLMYLFLVTEHVEQARNDSGLADAMRARLSEYSGPIADLARQIVDPKGVVYRPAESLMLEPRWHDGRVIVIGDAAHATTPHLAQGAAMAIEDAVLLAEMLEGEGEVPEILAAFTARRLPRVRHVLTSSLQISTWEVEQWAGIENPEANPGKLLGEATHALMAAY